jgi:hypothetical protein
MGSYLEAYGTGEAHRAQVLHRWKIGISIGVAALLVAIILYAVFRNYHEESIVNGFLGHLRNGEYQDAYRMWGCTEDTPCRDYPYPKFYADWGPQSEHPSAQAAKLGIVQTCGNGVVVQVIYPTGDPVPLFVRQDTGAIGFAPWPECPGRHFHFSNWWDSLWHRS